MVFRKIVAHLRGRNLKMLAPGQKAPAFEAEDHEGRTVRLADFAGKRVVLWFYPMADTPG